MGYIASAPHSCQPCITIAEDTGHVRKRKYTIALLALSSLVFFVTASTIINFFSMFLEPLGSEFSCDAGQKNADDIDVYVPGAGFSGFFYTMGRLQSMQNTTHEYYCFSAGCLALVASVLRQPADTVLDLAHSSRNRWIIGEISRYDVVEDFVDGLISNIASEAVIVDRGFNATIDRRAEGCESPTKQNNTDTQQYSLNRYTNNLHDLMSRMNVVTSTWTKGNILSQNIQTPTSVEHLKRMLIQTTWIPYITGSSFGIVERDTGVYHNDGAFAGLFKGFISQSKNEDLFSPCQHHYSLLLPWSLDLLSSSLNILMSRDRAVHFWEEGLKRGA